MKLLTKFDRGGEGGHFKGEQKYIACVGRGWIGEYCAAKQRVKMLIHKPKVFTE